MPLDTLHLRYMEIKEIKISEIKVSEANTRKDLTAGLEESGIEELAQSIQEKGLLNPIMVMEQADGKFGIIAGQRRFLAFQKLGRETIPAIVRDSMDSTDATIISLVENVHRADMNPIDKARAYQTIFDKYHDIGKGSKETGIGVQTIKLYLKLLNLAPSIQKSLSTSEGHAGILTLSKVAETFTNEQDQKTALNQVNGFTQKIQIEIIKRSGGDVSMIPTLTAQAQEGVFDTPICKGFDTCTFLEADEMDLLHKYREYKGQHNDLPAEDFVEVIRKLKNQL